MLGVILIHIFLLPLWVNDDAVMYLGVGGKLLDGQRPYVNYEEINFPMIHFISALPALLGRIFGVAPTLPLMLLMWLLVTSSAFYSAHLIGVFWPNLRPYAPYLALSVVGFSLWAYLVFVWAEREHIFILMVLPWFLLRTARYEQLTISPRNAFGIGVLMACAVAMKPHFILVIIFPELIWWFRTKQFFLLTPEVLAGILIGVGYILYFFLQPDVFEAFTLLLERLVSGYGAYGNVSITSMLLQQPTIWLGVIISSITLVYRCYQPVEAQPLLLTISTACLSSIAVYLLQQKGWLYHRVPADFFTVVLLTAWGVRYANQSIMKLSRLSRIAMFGLVFALCATQYGQMIQYIQKHQSSMMLLGKHIEQYSQINDPVMVIDTSVFPTYPTLIALNRQNASRYVIAHPIPIGYFGIEGLPYNDPNHIVPVYVQEYLLRLIDDIERHQPVVIIVRRGPCVACPEGLVLETYLEARQIFSSEPMLKYGLVAEDINFQVYALVKENNQP